MSNTQSYDETEPVNQPLVHLEKEINNVINNYKTWFHYGLENEKSIEEKPTKNNDSNITLEKVAADMTDVLDTLKKNLAAFKIADSYSDVAPQIEEMCIKRSKISNKDSVQPGNNQNKNNTNKTPIKKQSSIKNNTVSNASNVSKNSTNASNISKHSTNQSIASNKNANVMNRPATPTNSKQSGPVNLRTSALSNASNPMKINQTVDQYSTLRDEVQKAIRDRKTFTIRGFYPEIRRALLRRGWVEKIHPSYRDRFHEDFKKFNAYTIPELLHMLRNKEIAENCKKLLKSKLLVDHQVDLYWSANYDVYRDLKDNKKITKVNKLRRGVNSFTSKQGLSEAALKSFALSKNNDSRINHPRTYTLTQNGDTQGFINDFNITAAMALLKWVKQNSMSKQFKVISPSGKIPLEVFNFAVTECYKFIKKVELRDINDPIPDALDQEWNYFLEHYYKAVHVGNHFKEVGDVTEGDMLRKASYILKQLKTCWPFLSMDGHMNIWILKPINSSQGVGIHMCRTLKYILNVVKNNPNRTYVIQKYIERPLLIYKTKFDIRQWFLISSTVPLTIWMYKSCYLRFSSQTYNLRKLHESIHLTNNSVQCKYNKNISRDIALPPYNMWDSAQFKTYLSDIGYPKVFNDIIHPGMKECIVSTLLMHQSKLDKRRNTFELYGADFMLTEDFKPWLLEINSNPALHASTPITAKMCPAVLEDVIKVVVDYEGNKKANTGGFELVYKGALPSANGKQIEVIKTNKPNTNNQVEQKLSFEMSNISVEHPVICIRELGIGMRKTLEHLLEVVKIVQMKEKLAISQAADTSLSVAPAKKVSIETIMSMSQTETETQTPERLVCDIDSESNKEFCQHESHEHNENMYEDESSNDDEVD